MTIDWSDVLRRRHYWTDNMTSYIVDRYYMRRWSIEAMCDELIVSHRAIDDYMDKNFLPRRGPIMQNKLNWWRRRKSGNTTRR